LSLFVLLFVFCVGVLMVTMVYSCEPFGCQGKVNIDVSRGLGIITWIDLRFCTVSRWRMGVPYVGGWSMLGEAILDWTLD